ncbi:MAG TPA: MBL fold metallo-hydrolase [Negativicutes bacterium]|nr:MBL fold metallo-hydrolase [Negativicutes bacterium]
MEKAHAKITFLAHSGFAVETARCFFLFDYCPSMVKKSIITDELLKGKKHVYVLVSHSHGDHYDPAILRWGKANPAITYILSSDIVFDRNAVAAQVLSAYEQWSDANIQVETFGSTDEGISFLVQVDGLSIFHAGDLNWWRWSGEPQADQEDATMRFKAEMAKMAGRKIDLAFFPVDRRLEENYCIGAEYFAALMQPKLLIPMHFGVDFAATKFFAARAKQVSIPTVEITHEGQEILFGLADWLV